MVNLISSGMITQNPSPTAIAVLLALLANAQAKGWPSQVSTNSEAILKSLEAPRLSHNNHLHSYYYSLIRRTLMELYRAELVTGISLFKEQKLKIGDDEFSWLVTVHKRATNLSYSLPNEIVQWFTAKENPLLLHLHGGLLRLLWGRGNEIISKLYLSALNAGDDGCAYDERVLVTHLLGYSKKHISRYRPRITESFLVLEQMGFITRESVDLPPRKGVMFHRWRLSVTSSCGSYKIGNAPSGEILRLALSQEIDLGLHTRFA